MASHTSTVLTPMMGPSPATLLLRSDILTMDRTALLRETQFPQEQSSNGQLDSWLGHLGSVGNRLTSFALGASLLMQRRIMIYGVGSDAVAVKEAIDKSG